MEEKMKKKEKENEKRKKKAKQKMERAIDERHRPLQKYSLTRS